MSYHLHLLFYHLLSLSLLQSLILLHQLPPSTTLTNINHLLHLHSLHLKYLLNLWILEHLNLRMYADQIG